MSYRLSLLFPFIVAVSWALAASSLAQETSEGFALGRFDVAERGSDWFVGESLDLRGHPRGSIGVTADYAYKPLVFYTPEGEESASVVTHQLFLHVGGSLVLWDRLRLATNIPIAAYTGGNPVQVGNEVVAPESGASLGDIRLGADLRLVGEYGGVAQLALGVQVYLPTGSPESFTGDGAFRVMPRLLLAGDIAIFAYSVRAALNWRAHDEAVGGVPVGTEVFFAATAGLWLAKRKVLIGPELWGSTVVEDGAAFDKATTPFEILFGIHYRPLNWRFGVAAGPGLTRGLGAPAYRLLATVEWSPSVRGDRDRDGIFDDEDACPELPGPRSSNPEENGCPIRDRDRDGILDDVDACPDLYGVANEDPTKNGCPPEPPPDTDGDGIIDPEDACPNDPGPSDPDPAKNGCPKARIEGGQIKILERVEFQTDSARILPISFSLLQAVREIIESHPEIKRVSVEGHTDDVGTAAYNQGLSERRAKSVVDWLVKQGVSSSRLTSRGFGLEKPLDANRSSEGRQRNRRVEFHIVED